MTCIGQKAKDAEIVNQFPSPYNKDQKLNNTEPIPLIITIPTSRSQKVEDAEFCTKNAIKKTRTSRTIKLFAKAKDGLNF